MRRIKYLLLTIIFCVPMLVKAETLEYNICKSGCEYSTYEEILNHIKEKRNEIGVEAFSNYDIIINYKDSETYEVDSFGLGSVNSLTINGNNASITTNEILLVYINKVTLENLNITTEYADFYGIYDNSKFGNHEYNEYKNSIFNINNCSINATGDVSIIFAFGVFNIFNSSFSTNTIYSALSSISIDKTSTSTFPLLAGYIPYAEELYDTNIYLNLNDLEKNKEIIRSLYTDENINELITKYPELNESNPVLDKYFFLEVPLTEEYINNGITKTNNIFIKQEESKIIKANTNISEFEGEFVNTYEDSFGYDDIKDLPIEWKSENDSVAKLENGVIIPVCVGSVDLVGTRGNDIYTIHLTVEKETIPEKIDKMTIKVPITGSKIKAWVLIVGGILLGIIGVCVCMLIKRKK